MLTIPAQRLRRWSNIVQMLYKWSVFAGNYPKARRTKHGFKQYIRLPKTGDFSLAIIKAEIINEIC